MYLALSALHNPLPKFSARNRRVKLCGNDACPGSSPQSGILGKSRNAVRGNLSHSGELDDGTCNCMCVSMNS